MLKNKGKLCSVEDWNTYFNRSLKEKIKNDLYLVFEEEERNYEEWITLLNQSLRENTDEDYLKYICNLKPKNEPKKNSDNSQVLEETEAFMKHQASLKGYKKFEYKPESRRDEPKVESKKEDIKFAKEELQRLMLEQMKQQSSSQVARFQVAWTE